MGWHSSGLGGSAAVAEVEELEGHFHTRERWMGKSADQSGTDWAIENGLTLFRAISGNGTWGADANDEAKVLGTSDTPVIAAKTKFDIHRVLFVALSTNTAWYFRLVWGTGTMADAITAGQYSTVGIIAANATGPIGKGAPVEIKMPQLAVDTLVWAQAMNATDNATCDFLVGLHEYD